MEFTRAGFEEFRNDTLEALTEVAKKHGVKIELGNIKYDTYDFDMKMHVTKDEEDLDGNRLKFESECWRYGLKKSDYNREFIADGKKFRFVGFNNRARKNVCNLLCLINNKT